MISGCPFQAWSVAELLRVRAGVGAGPSAPRLEQPAGGGSGG